MAIVLKSLSISLGLFFILAGCFKLSSYFSKELHREVRAEFVSYSKVFPLSRTLEFKINSTVYRKTVGYLEVIFGIALAIFPNHFVKNGANVCLLLLTVLAIYSQFNVNAKLERTAPSYVFFFLLCGRLVVYYQMTRSTENTQEPTTNGCKQE
ncbi:hypothetical protein WA026_000860 [Henosepilachna vigintioctopunctata]|uniref:Novel acetylcholine receptor chaperone n=1 Tax=Henosepilachna vigintioctopunctata TaxID=420089 RepID=A0AAW1V8K0_9CUCU